MKYTIVPSKEYHAKLEPGNNHRFSNTESGYIIIREEKYGYKSYDWRDSKAAAEGLVKSLQTTEGIVEDEDGVKHRVVNFDHQTMSLPKGTKFYHLWQRKTFESQGYRNRPGHGPEVDVLLETSAELEEGRCFQFSFPNEYIKLVIESDVQE